MRNFRHHKTNHHEFYFTYLLIYNDPAYSVTLHEVYFCCWFIRDCCIMLYCVTHILFQLNDVGEISGRAYR